MVREKMNQEGTGSDVLDGQGVHKAEDVWTVR